MKEFRDILLLGIISFFADVSSEMIMPILPFFIYSLGGTGLAVGLIMGVGDGVANFAKIFSGKLSDKMGKRKVFMLAGYGSSAFSKLFFPFSTHWWHLLFLRGIERIGKGMRGPPRDALIGDLVKEKRGEAYGIHRALDTAGAVVGSMLVLFLLWLFGFPANLPLKELVGNEEIKEMLKIILIVASLIAFLAIPPIFLVREITGREKEEKEKLPKKLKKFIMIATIFYFGNFSYAFFLLRIGMENIFYAIFLYALFNISYAMLARYFGRLSDKIGRKFVISLGYITFTFVCVGFVFIAYFPSQYFIPLSIALFLLYGVVYAFIEGNQRAFVSDLSKSRGTAQGFFQASIGFASIPAGIIAGKLWDIFPELTFIYGAVLSLISAILLVTFDD
ncbi:MAG: MFS transporter [Thermoplasmata archaeon]|nr:MFS transporter [Thermoplasmata archaeon]